MSYSSPADAVTIVGPDGVTWHKNYQGQPPNAHGGGGVSATQPTAGGGGGPRPGGGGGSAGNAGPGSVDCQGAITATIEWQGSDPRPSCVIIKETATASWHGSSGSGSDGLGGVANDTGGEELSGSGSCSTVRYTVKSDLTNDPPPMTNAPIANAALPAPTGGLQGASANVSYKVEVFTVAITLRGTTVVNDIDYILTGQQITASVGGATLATTPAPTWSISTGADRCFGDFVVSDTTDNTTNPATTISQGKSEVKALVTNLPDFQFYTKKDGEVKVKCVATINVPDGTTKAVTLESKSITSKRPVVDYWDIRTGFVGWDSFRTNSNSGRDPLLSATPDDYMRFRGYNISASSGIAKRGQDWYALVNVPSPLSGGNMMWAQIVTAERHTFFPAVPTDRDAPFGQNGITGLDYVFPYENESYPTEAVGDSGDSPGQPKQGNKITASDSFETWLMFRPNPTFSGQSTTYVPLQKYKWSWNGTAQIDADSSASQEIWKIISSSAIFNPSVPPNVTAENTYDFPIWTAKVVGRIH